LLAVLVVFAVGIGVVSRGHTGAAGSRMENDNPNKFYLYATGKEFLVRYTYDPHAADLWIFRTAEGHLSGGNDE
jgi:hypothetical protein